MKFLTYPLKPMGRALILGGLWVLPWTGHALASSSEQSAKTAIEARLAQIVPDAPQAEIQATPVDGVWQVRLGGQIIYMSADGNYFFNGQLVDLNTRENLTEQALNAHRQSALASLNTDSMIIYPAQGERKHVLTVFTDVACPYCRKLHKDIDTLNQAGVEVRYLAYARGGVGSKGYNQAQKIWCAQQPAQAMDSTMKTGQLPDLTVRRDCQAPVKRHMAQAKAFDVQGTPTLILESGKRLPGYVPAKELLPMMGMSMPSAQP